MEKEANIRKLPFLTAMASAQRLYGLDMKEDDFIEDAYYSWRSLGNTASEVNRFFTTVPDDFIIEIPDDCESIQSITMVDYMDTGAGMDSSGYKESPPTLSQSNIPSVNQSITYTPGASINYKTRVDAVEITSAEALNSDIMIVYKSIQVGEDGLPLLNDKEVAALAADVARKVTVRKAFQGVTVGKDLLPFITAEADRLMAGAKVDEYINDDAIDTMLDIQTTWDRKVYGKRFNILK